MATKLYDELRQTKPFASLEEEVYLGVIRTAQLLQEPWTTFLRQNLGMTWSQYNLLRILRGSHPQGLTHSDIHERLVGRDPDVTRLVDRLQGQGFVTRERSAQDRRVVRVYITAEGLDRVNELDQPVRQMPKQLLSSVDVCDLEKLRDLLEEVRSTVGSFP